MDDVQQFRTEIKRNIEILIENNSIIEAREILKHYEKAVKHDIDVYSIKGIIAMVEGDIGEAKRVLKDGLTIDGDNFDLLYNLSYIYQRNNENELAIEYYIQALQNSKNATDEESVYERLRELGVKQSKEEIIGTTKPRTSIVILTYNNLEYNKLCIESIRKYTQKETYEIIVVDNHSTDGTTEWLKQQSDLKLILNDENLGFPKGCNQGIEIAEKDNDILLLNNDTIVTPNWLTNLKECLYSSPNIGSVGSVTNSCSNYQTIPANYNNLDEMVTFAESNNISNSALWEERLRLVGFCMLIKSEVIKKVGLLDEIYTPGNFEDDDYSLRIRKAGYRLMLCKDSFIHHFGSVSFGKISKEYSELLSNNRTKFHNKWRFDPYDIIEIRKDITELISKTASKDAKIIHIGCEGGGTLLDVKNAMPSSRLYGIESKEQLIENTDHFAQIEIGGFEKIELFKREYFDYIIITQAHENEEGILSTFKKVEGYLNCNGFIYISLDIDKIRQTKKLSEELQANFTDCQISTLSINGHAILQIKKSKDNSHTDALKLTKYNKEELNNLVQENIQNMQLKNDEDIFCIMRRLENDIEFEKNLNLIKDIAIKGQLIVGKIKKMIMKHGIDKVKLFNIMGIIHYQTKMYKDALIFLEEAFKLDKDNKDTVYNISFILHELNDNKTALTFLDQLKNCKEDLDIGQLRQQIEEAL